MVCVNMKKMNNKFRSNNNNNNSNGNYNQIYSLNYKFDSISIAGKFCGTALDLIKKYNELAKEALGNSDYVTAEVYRQYAEHYRKIVTDINEKKSSQKVISFPKDETPLVKVVEENTTVNGNSLCDSSFNNEEDIDIDNDILDFDDLTPAEDIVIAMPEKKEFKIIEISAADSKSELINNNPVAEVAKPKRVYRRRENKEVKEIKEDIAV